MNAANAALAYTGQALTEQFEGCALVAYRDSAGYWTLGYGHRSGVTGGMTCTPEQARAWLDEDIAWAASVVRDQVQVPLTQDEFNALVDFVFNVGSGNFEGSTMFADLNAGDYVTATAQFERWDMADGQVVAGLLRRRIAEENEFKGVSP